MVQSKSLNSREPKQAFHPGDPENIQAKTEGTVEYEERTVLSTEEVGRMMLVLRKSKSAPMGASKLLAAARKPMTPADQYREALKQSLYIAGKEGWLHLIPAKILELKALGPKAGKTPADIDKDVVTVYDFVYDTRKKSLMDRAHRGDEGPGFLKQLTQMADWGVKAGKTPVDITDDKKKIYQEFFNWAYRKAYDMAHRGNIGPVFHDRLSDMDRYGLLGGFMPSDVAKMKQLVFQELYRSSLEDLKNHLLAAGCNRPDKEIVLKGSTLTVQGKNCSGLLTYGAAAGLSPADMERDVNLLKNDIKIENAKRIERDLVGGVNTLLGVQRRAAKRLVRVAYRAGYEVGEGIQQLGRGAQNLVKQLI